MSAIDITTPVLAKLNTITSNLANGNYSELNIRDAGAVMGVLLGVYILYGILLAIYRVTFHPLARFPGYWICAVSEWYEFYCYVVKGGQWGNEVKKMHEKYGMSSLRLHILSGIYDLLSRDGRIQDLSCALARGSCPFAIPTSTISCTSLPRLAGRTCGRVAGKAMGLRVSINETADVILHHTRGNIGS